MTALEIRLIAYALLGSLLIGGTAWATWHLTSDHYKVVIDERQIATDQAIAVKQQQIDQLTAARAAVEQQAQVDHAKLVEANSRLSASMSDSLRGLEAALNLVPVPTTVADTCKPDGTGGGPGSDCQLEAAVRRFNDAAAAAQTACLHDSAELSTILEIAPKP